MTLPRRQHWLIENEHKNLTPYQFLCRVLPEVPQGVVRQLMREERVTVDGSLDAVARPLKKGALLELAWTDELHRRAHKKRKQTIDAEVLLEGERFVVLNKPSGVSVVPERRREHDTLLDLLPDDVKVDETTGATLKVVHRIDKGTSGALLLARDRDAKRWFTEAFYERRVKKEYLAWVRGAVYEPEIRVTEAIGKDRRHALRMRVDPERGKPSETLVRVDHRFDGYTRLRCFPITGRTHQIRVHLAHLGFPLLGDPLYGGVEQVLLSDLKRGYRPKAGVQERPILARLALHCLALEFEDESGVRHRAEAPLPKDLLLLEKQLERFRPGRRAPP